MDIPACIKVVSEFTELCAQVNALARTSSGDGPVEPIEKDILRRTPQIQAIAKQCQVGQPAYFHRDSFMAAGAPTTYIRAEETSTQLLGHLERLEATEAMLGPTGPQLAATGLHPWVWSAAVNLWDGEHYRNAIQDAYTAVEQQARIKSGITETGYRAWVMFQVRGEENQQRLRLPNVDREHDSENWKSVHDGAADFGRGCASSMRNLAAHSTGEFGEQEALEQLAAISYLARLVDRSEATPPANSQVSSRP